MSENKAQPWPPEKFAVWYQQRPVIAARDYVETLVSRIKALGQRPGFKLEKYGEATYTTNDNSSNVDSTNKTNQVTHDLFRLLIGDFSQESDHKAHAQHQ